MASNNRHLLQEMRKHIDSRFFRPSMAVSLFHMIRDIVAIVVISVGIYFALVHQQYLLALILSVINGNFFFALFVVGHDCGHGSFSSSKRVNNVVGFVAHHFLLTPYWAWKKSHERHHMYSGNLNKDESIVPFNRDEAQQALGVRAQDKKSFLKVRLFNLFIFLTGINFHLYTVYNPRTKASHFWPNRVFLSKKDDKWIYLGLVTTVVFLVLLVMFAWSDFWFFLLAYMVPIFICYHLMGMVTLMQHHDADSGWYYDEDWDYVSGALNTFDYRYGWLNPLIRHWHHDIAHYHVVHHLFSAIPHYHLKAVSERLAKEKILLNEPKSFSYWRYVKIIWSCNFVENKVDETERYKLKAFEEL